jgi:hypothetical protein
VKNLFLSTIVGVSFGFAGCSTLEKSYDAAIGKYDAINSKVSDVRSIKSDVRYMKSKAFRVMGKK